MEYKIFKDDGHDFIMIIPTIDKPVKIVFEYPNRKFEYNEEIKELTITDSYVANKDKIKGFKEFFEEIERLNIDNMK